MDPARLQDAFLPLPRVPVWSGRVQVPGNGLRARLRQQDERIKAKYAELVFTNNKKQILRMTI